MRKGIIGIVLVGAVALAGWSGGRSEPAPSPPPTTPTVLFTTTMSYGTGSSCPYGSVVTMMRINVRYLSNGRREFAGTPSFSFQDTPLFPYIGSVPEFCQLHVTYTSPTLITATIMRAWRRVISIDPSTGLDRYRYTPYIGQISFNLVFTP
jgi:hypothetical protein